MNLFLRRSVAPYLLYLIIFLIPFSVRHVFESVWNYQTGAYSDFTSLSLYISDLILIAFVILVHLFHEKHELPKIWKYSALVVAGWLILELFLQSKDLLPLQLYFSVRILFLIVFAISISQIRVSREKFAWLFTILGGIQSLIAIVQFYSQKSVGLYLLGESHLSASMYGVAKIVSHGTTLIRGYGTFPHSNLFAAFLVFATILNLYLIAKSYQTPRGVAIPRGRFSRETIKHDVLWLNLAFNIFGILVSFSRASILGFGIGGLIILIYFLHQRHFHLIYKIIIPSVIIGALSVVVLAPYLLTRTTITDNATKERLFYNQVGAKIVENKPFFGLGPGTSVLHMKQYSSQFFQYDLKPWEVQPIHNLYLISWAEWGIGAIPWLILIIYPIFALFKRKRDLWNISLIAIGLGFLIMGLFDHYFYTIWPTQLLLWLVLGLQLNSFMWNMELDVNDGQKSYI